MFISALFGDLEVSFAPDGGLFFHAGRNGRLHITEPDGSVRGNHPYLSALMTPVGAWNPHGNFDKLSWNAFLKELKAWRATRGKEKERQTST